MVLNNRILFLLFVSFVCGGATSEQYKIDDKNYFKLLSPDYDHKQVKLYDFIENQKHSYIVFIRDHENNKYIVKQEKSCSLSAQLRIIFEMLASYMAVVAGVSSQRVELLSIDFCFPGKFMCDKPATIHTVMPGTVVRELTSGPYQYLVIKQPNDPAARRLGLNRRVIRCMAMHPDLPPIVAFDTFIGNKDRNRANIIYDSEGDRFYAIDMGVIYDTKNGNSPISELACKYIEYIIIKQKVFHHKERIALEVYYNFLKKLLDYFPPDRTYALLRTFVAQSGLENKYALIDPDFVYIMNTYEEKIKKAYIDIQRLVVLLSNVLGT